MQRGLAGSLLFVLFLAPRIGAEPAWRPFDLKPADAQELADIQSPLHRIEQPVPFGQPVSIGGERFTFTAATESQRVVWTRVGAHLKKDKRTRSGSFRVPGALHLATAVPGPYRLQVRVSSEGVTLASRHGLRIPIGKDLGYLIDVDLDGTLGGPGDAYVAPASRTAGPWSGEAWHASGGVRYRRSAAGGWERRPCELPHPLDRDHSATWCLLQWRRQQCGCLPLIYDVSLEDGMRKHAAYLAKNEGPAHSEDSARPGYTPEGDRAARNCIIGHGDASCSSAMQMHLATMYHRTRPLQPGLQRTAMVFHEGTFLFDVFSHRGGPHRDALLVYPPHGMRGVPQRFHEQGEHPMPVEGIEPGGNRLGTAVNVFSEPLRVASALSATPTLTLKDGKRRKRQVEGHLHFPGQPPSARAGASNRGNVALIPSAPLRARARYLANARIPLPDGTVFIYRWWFETGRKTKKRRR